MDILTVHGMSASGNCHKVRMVLEHLHRPYTWNEVDLRTGATRTPEFLARNPTGQVPVLEYADGRCLAESNAILIHLAENTSLWPKDRWQRAQVLQWLFFEQYSHEPYIAVARYICRFLPADHERRAELPRLQARGQQALQIMEDHLGGRPFLVGEYLSVADIALYAYTSRADEGGFKLDAYPALCAWLARVSQQRGCAPMAIGG